MTVTVIDTPSLGPGHPLYGNITAVPISPTATLITIAGQVAGNPDGTIPESLEEQVTSCLDKISVCLDAADAKVTDITRFMYYIAERAWDDVEKANGRGAKSGETLKIVFAKVGAFLGGHRPASCFNVIRSMTREVYLCEFEAQAVVLKN